MLQVAEGIYQVRIPVPFPMKFVNCYLARGTDGWDLMDTGMSYGPAFDTWQEAMAELGIDFAKIRAIYITHIHADHYGLAKWFQDRSGAPVYMLRQEWDSVPLWEDPRRLPALLTALFDRNGMPASVLDDVVGTMVEIQQEMGPRPTNVRLLEDGDQVWFGNRSCRVIWTPGHCDGMFCLYAEQDGLFLVADHVLPKITPNVSIWPESRPDPLADYLHSLDRVRPIPTSLALPGHGTLIQDLPGRIDELKAHHGERLEETLRGASGGRTAYEVTTALFRENLTPHQIRFAMAETLAHLEYLANQRALVRQELDGRTLYVPA